MKRNLNQEDRAELYSQLREYWRLTGLCCLSAEAQPQKQLAVPTIEEIIFSEKFMLFPTGNEQIEFLKSKVSVDLDTVEKSVPLFLDKETILLATLFERGF